MQSTWFPRRTILTKKALGAKTREFFLVTKTIIEVLIVVELLWQVANIVPRKRKDICSTNYYSVHILNSFIECNN